MPTQKTSPISDGALRPWDDLNLAQLRHDMVRFARLQLRNQELAEDAVQDALTAAFTASGSFEHRASMKTWVFSILKNKIVDLLRDRWNKNRIDFTEDGDVADFDILFQKNEHWKREEKPTSWGNPEQSLADRQFWEVFEVCMDNLPETMARVFAMREFLGLEANEICKELDLSASNCWVILHRARMHLRLCLQQRWFEKDEQK